MNKTIKQLLKDTSVDTLSGERLNQLVNITDRLMCALNCADNCFVGDSNGQKVIDEAKQRYYAFVGPTWKPTPEEIEQLKAGQHLR